jgi:hypothetical protein
LVDSGLGHHVVSGLHWGSQCPVNPDVTAIFDFLPGKLHSRIANAADLGVLFAFDWWVSNLDSRQYVFVRQPGNPDSAHVKSEYRYTAWAIDHGSCFGGADWALASSGQPVTGHRPLVFYPSCRSEDVIHGGRLIESLSPAEICGASQHVPRNWFAPPDEESFQSMMNGLRARQRSLTALLGEQTANTVVLNTLFAPFEGPSDPVASH